MSFGHSLTKKFKAKAPPKSNDKSITDLKNIEEFIDLSEHAYIKDKVLSEASFSEKEHLLLPRRPIWNKNMKGEELNALETAMFYDWRKNLAK